MSLMINTEIFNIVLRKKTILNLQMPFYLLDNKKKNLRYAIMENVKVIKEKYSFEFDKNTNV